jgi:hypothetical protein
MPPLMDVLVGLSPVHDPELTEGFQRYVTLMETILTPEQLEAYADFIQRSGTFRIFDAMTPEELAALSPELQVIATAITADEMITLENRRVAALLNQRGLHNLAPDLPPSQENAAQA